MGFRLVPKSMTLNDSEQPVALTLRYSTEFSRLTAGGNYVKVVKIDPYCL